MGNKQSDFGASTKAEEVVKAYKENCDGKFVIVTGGNSGIGLETVKQLSANGAKVVLCSRSVKNGEDSVSEFKTLNPAADITVMQLDLGSFKSVYAFADAYKATKKPLNILINNAGIMACPRALTEEGFESQFGVNHMGHFLLTTQLMPLLIAAGTKDAPSRVVNLSSWANVAFTPPAGIDFDDLTAEKSYQTWERYGASKLANILFTKELNRRCAEAGQHVISASLHPGAILATHLFKDQSAGNIGAMLSAIGLKGGALYTLAMQRMKSIPEGASTTCVAALSPHVVPGAYYSDCQVCTDTHAQANDEEAARRLWKVSEELVAAAGKK